jgi:hypothetical protein
MDSSSSGGPQVAVAVRGDGRGSRRAAQWAAASLSPAAGRVVLVHVIPPLAFVPTPCKESPAFSLDHSLSLLLDSVATDSRELMMVVCPFLAAGELVPVERMDRGTVEMYAEDRRARAQDVFLPFRRICGRRPVSSDPVLLTAATKVPSFFSVLQLLRPFLLLTGIRPSRICDRRWRRWFWKGTASRRRW